MKFTREFLTKSVFPGDVEGAKFLKNYENSAQGAIFVTLRVRGHARRRLR